MPFWYLSLPAQRAHMKGPYYDFTVLRRHQNSAEAKDAILTAPLPGLSSLKALRPAIAVDIW